MNLNYLPSDFWRSLSRELPTYLHDRRTGEWTGPFLFRECPRRLAPISESAAWAMLRLGGYVLKADGTQEPVYFPTYSEAKPSTELIRSISNVCYL